MLCCACKAGVESIKAGSTAALLNSLWSDVQVPMNGTYGLEGHNPMVSGQAFGWLTHIPWGFAAARPSRRGRSLNGVAGYASPTVGDYAGHGTAAGGLPACTTSRTDCPWPLRRLSSCGTTVGRQSRAA